MIGERYAVSFSGGKDSLATALYMRELGIECEILHADTHWESPIHAEYMDRIRDKLGVRIVDSPGFEALCFSRGMFPCRVRRFCTQELKIWPLDEARSEGATVVLGVRAAESAARAGLPERSEESGHSIWRPLIGWSEEDVWRIIRRHGVEPHPLYALGASRVGCWPCVFAGRADLRLLHRLDPLRVEYIADLERRVQQVAWSRGRQSIPTFQALRFRGSARHVPVGFRERMAWALSDRGGYEPSPQACLLDGLCE